MSRPRWRDVQQFCRRQGYREDRTTHWQYEKIIVPGFMSWTQVSFSKPNEQIGAHLWRKVWHEQLKIASEDDFWNGLRGDTPRYNIPPLPEAPRTLPPYLVTFLQQVEHLTPEQAAAVTEDDAVARWLAYHSRELLEP